MRLHMIVRTETQSGVNRGEDVSGADYQRKRADIGGIVYQSLHQLWCYRYRSAVGIIGLPWCARYRSGQSYRSAVRIAPRNRQRTDGGLPAGRNGANGRRGGDCRGARVMAFAEASARYEPRHGDRPAQGIRGGGRGPTAPARSTGCASCRLWRRQFRPGAKTVSPGFHGRVFHKASGVDVHQTPEGPLVIRINASLMPRVRGPREAALDCGIGDRKDVVLWSARNGRQIVHGRVSSINGGSRSRAILSTVCWPQMEERGS